MNLVQMTLLAVVLLVTASACGDDVAQPDAAPDANPDATLDATPDGTLDATPDAALDLTLRTAWGSEETLEVVMDGIYAIWWDPRFDHAADAVAMFDQLGRIRRDRPRDGDVQRRYKPVSQVCHSRAPSPSPPFSAG